MLGIFSYINRLRTNVEKNAVSKDIDATIKLLTTQVIGSVASVADHARITTPKSKVAKEFESDFYAAIKMSRKPSNVFLALGEQLDIMLVNLESLKKIVEDNMEQDNLRDGITARGAHMIRTASSMGWVARFTQDLIDMILRQETADVTGEPDDGPPAQERYLMSRITEYCRVLSDMSIPNKDFLKIFSDLPSVYLDRDNKGGIANSLSRTELDPFKNLATMDGFRGNPIYMVRMMFLNSEISDYQAAKDKKQVAELRLMHLKNVIAGSPNMAIEREIEGIQKRIDSYNQKIREVEATVK